jgi:tRNA threonylcarbamoyladenosine biosynthesis protein TsaE
VPERALDSSAQTEALGAALGRALEWSATEARTLYLKGELGSGKTTLARGLLRALGVAGPIRSPSYALIETYALTAGVVAHVDLYRLNSPEELEQLGLRDYFAARALLLIEWPERAGDLPPPDLQAQLQFAGDERRCELTTHSSAGVRWLSQI